MATLNDVIAFNEQLEALQEAAVPLNTGLDRVASTHQMAQINMLITKRVAQGERLEEAIAEADRVLPPTYRALVQAGLRGGDLPDVVARLSSHDATLVDVKRSFRRACFYPLLVCGIAFVLFVMHCVYLVPVLVQTIASLEVEQPRMLVLLASLREWVLLWAPMPFVLIAVLSVYRGRARPGSESRWTTKGEGVWSYLPGMSKIRVDTACAKFADVLSGLVERDVPRNEAIPLAAAITDEPVLVNAALQSQVRASGQRRYDAFPPLLRWVLDADNEDGKFATRLRMIAGGYQQRALHRADWYRIVFPSVTCVALGGTIVLIFCLSLFSPVVDLFFQLA